MERADGGANIVMKHTDIRHGARPMPEKHKSSLQVTDEAAAAVQKTPHRVSLDSIMSKVEHTDYINPDRHPHMTICLITMENGFVLVGKSTPADPQNFDAELGKKFAKDDALRHAWPLEAYLLLERMSTMPNKL